MSLELYNRPVLLEPNYARTLGVQSLNVPQPSAGNDLKRQAQGHGSGMASAVLPVVAGIAVIDVAGVILHRTGLLHPVAGVVGIDGIQFKLEAAADDPDVCGILLNINSPGGQVAGLFDLTDAIYEARKEKPIWAMLDELGASAAYALASAANHVVLPRTGQAGSIGVVMAHVDQSEQLAKEGLKVSLIHAGKHKTAGHPFAPLPDDVRGRFQAEIDDLYSLFTQTVARNRGMNLQRVRDTEAALLTGSEAIRAGLADEVMASRHVLEAFDKSLRGERGARPAVAAKTSPTIQDVAACYWGYTEERSNTSGMKTRGPLANHDGIRGGGTAIFD